MRTNLEYILILIGLIHKENIFLAKYRISNIKNLVNLEIKILSSLSIKNTHKIRDRDLASYVQKVFRQEMLYKQKLVIKNKYINTNILDTLTGANGKYTTTYDRKGTKVSNIKNIKINQRI